MFVRTATRAAMMFNPLPDVGVAVRTLEQPVRTLLPPSDTLRTCSRQRCRSHSARSAGELHVTPCPRREHLSPQALRVENRTQRKRPDQAPCGPATLAFAI